MVGQHGKIKGVLFTMSLREDLYHAWRNKEKMQPQRLYKYIVVQGGFSITHDAKMKRCSLVGCTLYKSSC